MLAILILALAFSIYVFKKTDNAYENQVIILDAIWEYSRDVDWRNLQVSTDDVEGFYETMWRLSDWSYKNILPPEKLKLIEPYILPYKEAKKRMKERGIKI